MDASRSSGFRTIRWLRCAAAAILTIAVAALATADRSAAQTSDAGAMLAALGAKSVGDVSSPEALTCSLNYNLPGDIGVTLPSKNHPAFDKYSWETFRALNAPGVGERLATIGDNRTQWEKWSSTESLIQCAREPESPNCVCPGGDCFASGTRYYPDECRAIKGYRKYRILGEVSKVDDLFLQATHGGLSNDPLIDANGNFLRFEILASPVTHDYVIDNEFYTAAALDAQTENLVFPCGVESYTGGDPANTKSGAIVVKNAWMLLPNKPAAIGYKNTNQYHTEEVLIYTPSYRNKSGVATCEKQRVGLVGQHIARKTQKQPRWTWSTFEHRRNAPSCKELPPSGNQGGSSQNTSCPKNVGKNFNFYPKSCSKNGSKPDACQTCNAAPVSNRKGCDNPAVEGDTSWCLDKKPKRVAGITRACRQVNIAEYYPSAHELNKTCAANLGSTSVWSNYQLISTQWYNKNDGAVCQTRTNVKRNKERPKVPIKGQGGRNHTPYLANSSMETYVRSNCMGCHGHPTVGVNNVSTDFMYWILLESYNTDTSSDLATVLENAE